VKVVLFCGGLGTRMREHSETIPKPLVHVGNQPILLHLMKYYAHYGHTEFILCLGYRGDLIKEFFLGYNKALYHDFRISDGGKRVELYDEGVGVDWKVSLVDTGINANIGERLKTVAPYLEDDEVFLANYSDGLSDLALPQYVDTFCSSEAVAGFLSVRPSQSFHLVEADEEGYVVGLEPVRESEIWINGGFFVLRSEIFKCMDDGEELVEEPFRRLARERRLVTRRYRGFWASIDTYKDKIAMDELYAAGDTPWMVWKR
jgi:glucose-1-phosphate cytidylyltransferase